MRRRARAGLARRERACGASSRAPRSARSGPGRRARPRRSASRPGRRRRDRRAACPARARPRRRRGPRVAATARTTASSLNGRRSSKLPPPRASTTTSTSGCAASAAQRGDDRGGRAFPCTRVSQTTTFAAGKRAPIVATRSPRAAASAPVRIPIARGSRGSGRFRSGAKSPSAASLRFRCSSASRCPPRPMRSIVVARRPSSPFSS